MTSALFWSALNKQFLVIFITIFLFSGVSGCSIFFYGYTKEEWNALSEDEKRTAKEEYQRVMEIKKSQEDESAIDERAESFEDYGIKKTIP